MNGMLTDGTLRKPPRLIDHPELHATHAETSLFDDAVEIPAEGQLNARQELAAFKQLQFHSCKLDEIWNLGRMTAKRRKAYLAWYDRYEEQRDRLVNANLGLVFKLLGRNRYTNVEFEEMRSEGLMALLRAVDSYNPWSGFKFSTYACNSIIRAFSRAGRMQQNRHHLSAASYDPRMEPSNWLDHQQAERLSLLTERIALTLAENRAVLNDNEAFVIKHRFGRQSAGTATLKAVGRMMNISKERVRQIQGSALAKLRTALSSDPVLQ